MNWHEKPTLAKHARRGLNVSRQLLYPCPWCPTKLLSVLLTATQLGSANNFGSCIPELWQDQMFFDSLPWDVSQDLLTQAELSLFVLCFDRMNQQALTHQCLHLILDRSCLSEQLQATLAVWNGRVEHSRFVQVDLLLIHCLHTTNSCVAGNYPTENSSTTVTKTKSKELPITRLLTGDLWLLKSNCNQ